MQTQTDANPYRRAIEYLDEHGWCQGHYFDHSAGTAALSLGETPPACVVGSLIATQQLTLSQPADYTSGMLARLLEFSADEQQAGWTVTDWNDAPGRSVEDVKLLLKQAAIDWDEGRRE
jgi:hypothetical protein